MCEPGAVVGSATVKDDVAYIEALLTFFISDQGLSSSIPIHVLGSQSGAAIGQLLVARGNNNYKHVAQIDAPASILHAVPRPNPVVPGLYIAFMNPTQIAIANEQFGNWTNQNTCRQALAVKNPDGVNVATRDTARPPSAECKTGAALAVQVLLNQDGSGMSTLAGEGVSTAKEAISFFFIRTSLSTAS